MSRTCSVDGCEREHLAKGYCKKHYRRWRAHGDPLYTGKDMKERLLCRSKENPGTGCWEWQGGKTVRGYGVISDRKGAGRQVGAHRASYEAFNGPIPEGAFVLHKCDNPSCINPDHLFAGDHFENMRDMHEKGRGRKRDSYQRGNRHPSSKLTDEDVEEIKRRLSEGESKRRLAADFGVSKTLIRYIGQGRVWSHLEEDRCA